MENYVIVSRDSEMYHHGIKGQKWGIRRYQKKDGSLTLQGKIHYGSESRKLAKAKEKLKEEKKAASTYKKNKAKLDKLEADKQKVAEQRKALKDKKSDKPEETAEQKKARLLKSTDAKEIYKDKDVLTDQELQNRVNRINLENQLSSKIPAEKSGLDKVMDKVDTASKTINSATELFNKIDKAYSSVANSTLAKAAGLDLPTGPKEKIKEFNMDEFVKNMHKMSNKDREAGVKIMKDMNAAKTIYDKMKKDEDDAKAKTDKAAADKKYEEGKKEYDEYNENIQKEAESAKYKSTSSYESGTSYRNSGDDIADGKTYTKNATILLEDFQSTRDNSSSGKSYVDDSNILQGVFYTKSDGTLGIKYERD